MNLEENFYRFLSNLHHFQLNRIGNFRLKKMKNLHHNNRCTKLFFNKKKLKSVGQRVGLMQNKKFK